MKKPNILFFMCDQMRFDALRFRGCLEINTPNLDRLSKRGVFFENAFTTDPICVPARASITTGMYPHKCTGRKANTGAIKDGMPLMGEIFKENGYSTYALGKLHYLPYTPPGTPRVTHGFDTVELCESGRMVALFDPLNEQGGVEDYHDYLKTVGWGGYNRADAMGNNDVFPATTPLPKEHFVDAWVAGRSLFYLEQHLSETPEKPFFMWTSFPKPHSAFDPPRPFDAMYDPRDMSAPTGSIQDMIDRGISRLYTNHNEYMWDCFSQEALKNIKAHYYGLITHQDEQIGRVLDYLEEKNILDDTIIVYTADHGEMLGDFGLFFKSNMYNASVRVPFMVSYPEKLPSGIVSDAPAGLQDVLPTLAALCGVEIPSVDGLDLAGVVNKTVPERAFFVSQCLEGENQQYMLCDKEYKFIYNAFGGIEELYDMRADIKELHNLAAEKPELVGKYRALLINWCVENGDTDMVSGGKLAKYEKTELKQFNNFKGYGRRKY